MLIFIVAFETPVDIFKSIKHTPNIRGGLNDDSSSRFYTPIKSIEATTTSHILGQAWKSGNKT